jgi:type IV fimbrial biogenesis protein FimT
MKINQRGFTLIELLVVVTIAAILMALAVPSFHTLLVKRSVQGAALALVSDLRFARSEALRRSSPVSVCSLAANSTSTCSGAPANWANGWMVFADPSNRGTRDAGEEIVRVEQAPTNIVSIQGAIPPPNSDLSVITFEANGWAKLANQTFIFTPSGSVPANTVRIVCTSLQGRVRLLAEGASACS